MHLCESFTITGDATFGSEHIDLDTSRTARRSLQILQNIHAWAL